MKKVALALILIVGCGGEESPLPPAKLVVRPKTVVPPPPPVPAARAPENLESVPLTKTKETLPVPAPAPAYIPVPSRPRHDEEGQIHLAAFKLRSVSGRKAEVFINGEAYSTLPALWAVTSGIEFDPRIPVASWPPEGARYAGSTTNLEDETAGCAEIYIACGASLEAAVPHLQKGEHVVYVKARFKTGLRQGALRLWTGAGAPLRYTGYAPFVAAESEEESRLLRTIWFDDPSDD